MLTIDRKQIDVQSYILDPYPFNDNADALIFFNKLKQAQLRLQTTADPDSGQAVHDPSRFSERLIKLFLKRQGNDYRNQNVRRLLTELREFDGITASDSLRSKLVEELKLTYF